MSDSHSPVRKSLKMRLLVPILTTTVVVVGVLSAAVLFTSLKEAEKNFDERFATLTAFIRQTSEAYFFNYDVDSLDTLVKIATSDPAIKFLVFYDNNGKQISKMPLPANANNLQIIDQDVHFMNDKLIGRFSLGLDRSYYVQRLKVVSFSIAGMTLLALGLLSLFATRTVTSVVRSIKIMTDSIEHMSKGDYSKSIDHVASDEIGQMANALREMIRAEENKVEVATAIAAGNLCKDVHVLSENDFLGKAFSSMNARLNEIVTEMKVLGLEVTDSSKLISNSSHVLSDGAGKQASALQDISNMMTVISAQTQQNERSVTEANEFAATSLEAVNQGASRITALTHAMEEISTATSQINKIIRVIDDIAFQTNLLALNAAVEAARAGRQGKGFAVVAQEVRNLAGRSAKAVEETSALIQESVTKVEHGRQLASETATSLNDIVARSNQLAQSLNTIAAASTKQAKAVSQVHDNLSEVDAVMQINVTNAEQTAGLACSLTERANSLQSKLARFVVRTEGNPTFQQDNSSSWGTPAPARKKAA